MEKGLLSVVIPVYNVEAYLRECVESVQKQTYRKLEIILVDDGSTDGSGAICDEYAAQDERIRVIHQENRGVMRAREAGIETATGEYLAFVDGDDWLEPDMYASLIPEMEGADLVCSGYFQETKHHQWLEIVDRMEERLYTGLKLKDFFGCFLYDFDTDVSNVTGVIWNKVFYTERMRQLDFYRDYPIPVGEDMVLSLQYTVHCDAIRVVKQCYYHYRYRETSAHHSENDEILICMNHVYLALKKEFSRSPYCEALMRQLQKRISLMTITALSEHMGFSDETKPICHILDARGLYGKRVVLFGAGTCGKDYYRQLKKLRIPIVAWMASWPKTAFGQETEDIRSIVDKEYDIVLIASAKKSMAEEMRAQLVGMGVPDDKLYWREPMDV